MIGWPRLGLWQHIMGLGRKHMAKQNCSSHSWEAKERKRSRPGSHTPVVSPPGPHLSRFYHLSIESPRETKPPTFGPLGDF